MSKYIWEQRYCKDCGVEVDKYKVYCPACGEARQKNNMADYQRKQQKETLSFIREYKLANGCAICGENFPAALDFHHREGKASKEEAIGRMYNRSVAKVMKQIDKCILLCANHHRKIHGPLPD